MLSLDLYISPMFRQFPRLEYKVCHQFRQRKGNNRLPSLRTPIPCDRNILFWFVQPLH